MGQYAHGNEPIQHMLYLYDYAGQPWKAQQWLREVMDRLYTDQPDGLCGDEDNGQTSAWYVFSALGFYPVCSGSGQYVIGAPLFQKATLRLENGSQFVIEAPANGPDNRYIQSARLLGKPFDRTWIGHDEIEAGGRLTFTMGPTPQKEWGTGPDAVPTSMSRQDR
jgi:predicted alpha-1,2-mannosidase